MENYYYMTPAGPLLLVYNENGLQKSQFVPDFRGQMTEERPECLKTLLDQMDRYNAGEAVWFTLEQGLPGTPFQKRVWEQVLRIPWGETRSYIQIAAEIGHPGAMRAVGTAVGANPFHLIIPCHRVINANGDLGGFAAGMPVKIALLKHEGLLFK